MMSALSTLVILFIGVLSIGGPVAAIEGLEEIYELMDELYHLHPKPSLNEVIDLINKVSVQVDAVSKQLDASNSQVLEAIYSLKNFISLEIEMNEVQRLKNIINTRYRHMQLMMYNIAGYEPFTLIDFARISVGSSSDSIDSLLYGTFFTYFGYRKLSLNEIYERIPLIDKIAKEFKYEETHNLCTSISAQQYFYTDYLEMVLLEIQGYLINTFSWNILRLNNMGAFINEAYDSFSEHQKRSNYMRTKFQSAIAEAGTEIRKCDPDMQILGVTYDQFTRISQGFIVNSGNIGSNYYCKLPCSAFQSSTVSGCKNSYDSYCSADVGNGNVFNCEADSKHEIVNVCLSSNPFRRYEYFETNSHTTNAKLYGQKVSCTENIAKSSDKCNYCYCLLDEESVNSDRYFYLNQVYSNILSNKVVTGIRFIKVNRVFHLQIQQGTLAPFGQVDPTTLEWKPVDEYVLPENVVNYQDVFKLNADVNNAIDLDNLHTDDPTYVVTGVKMNADSVGQRLKLAIRVTKYEFGTGKLLIPCGSKWIYSSSYNSNFLPLNEPSVSTTSPAKSEVTRTYDAVRFTHSSKVEDAAQTTLPFFDIQEVESYSPVPLSGVGLYHKGLKGNGGFIAPRIFSLDYSTHI